jgi:hypothetical protein
MFRRPIAHPLRGAALGLALTGVLGGCSSLSENTRMPEASEYNTGSRRDSVRGRLGGTDGIIIFGTDRSTRGTAAGDVSGAGIGVNAFLWRATLDTLSFMPLTSADPFGGVVITDWYQPPGAGNERFRVTAYILGRTLRSDGVRVVVFRQELRQGNWVDASVSATTATELEDQVLNRARELRAQSTSAAQ